MGAANDIKLPDKKHAIAKIYASDAQKMFTIILGSGQILQTVLFQGQNKYAHIQ